jgi:hypothetical protein
MLDPQGAIQSEPALVLELMLELGLALLALLALLATSSLDLVCILAIPGSGFVCSRKALLCDLL